VYFFSVTVDFSIKAGAAIVVRKQLLTALVDSDDTRGRALTSCDPVERKNGGSGQEDDMCKLEISGQAQTQTVRWTRDHDQKRTVGPSVTIEDEIVISLRCFFSVHVKGNLEVMLWFGLCFLCSLPHKSFSASLCLGSSLLSRPTVRYGVGGWHAPMAFLSAWKPVAQSLNIHMNEFALKDQMVQNTVPDKCPGRCFA
jgi:hypothetical protein